MRMRYTPSQFCADESGGILVFWACAVVAFLGFAALIFDFGRLSATHAELQSFTDSVALTAAAELDGKADAITRAQAAANDLITDSQTFATGGALLNSAEDITLTFYQPAQDGTFLRDPGLETTNPRLARFVRAESTEHRIGLGFGAVFASVNSGSAAPDSTAASATAGFSLEACNVAPVAVCLPTVDFDAETSIGKSLQLDASVNLGNLLPGNVAIVNSVTNLLDGLSICAGLLGDALNACLIAAREPETACTGQGGLELSVSANGDGLMDALNTRLGIFEGLFAGSANDQNFSPAPNVLTGLTNLLGLCLPSILPTPNSNIGLPLDDNQSGGSLSVVGSGSWGAGRTAYINAHYNGKDPFPQAQTRFEFYQAEIAASGTIKSGGLVGNILTGLFQPKMCSPVTNTDPKRRLMVFAGIDCNSVSVDAAVSVPPVQQFFEGFVLNPITDGKLAVEITACLGGGCGKGNLDTDVRDIVRLVE